MTCNCCCCSCSDEVDRVEQVASTGYILQIFVEEVGAELSDGKEIASLDIDREMKQTVFSFVVK